MTMHQNMANERENERKRPFFPLLGADARGNKEGSRKWGVVGSLRQNRCFADDSPLAPTHILYLSFYLIYTCLFAGCYGKWGPLFQLNKLEIPSCNSLSNLLLLDANAKNLYVRDCL